MHTGINFKMSVRRLAAESVQPTTFAFSADSTGWVNEQIAKYPAGRQASAVIPLLWKAQEQNQYWLPKAAIEHVADMLNMPYMRVLEVATFYTMFNLEPVGKHFIQLCGTTPCRLNGAGDIVKVLENRIGPQGHVSADGNFSWLEVECLGACCNAPMVQINNDYYEDLTPETFNALLDNLASGKSVKTGPQNGRNASEPQNDVKTLTDAALFDGSVVGAWQKSFEERRKTADAAKAAAAASAGQAASAQPVVEAAAPSKSGAAQAMTDKAVETKKPVDAGPNSGTEEAKAAVKTAAPDKPAGGGNG